MVAGPEVSRLVAEYEVAANAKDATKSTSHHERTKQAQTPRTLLTRVFMN